MCATVLKSNTVPQNGLPQLQYDWFQGALMSKESHLLFNYKGEKNINFRYNRIGYFMSDINWVLLMAVCGASS